MVYRTVYHQNKESLQCRPVLCLLCFAGARDRSRTDTSLRTADFESAASTNSATWAGEKRVAILQLLTHLVQKAPDIFLLKGVWLRATALFWAKRLAHKTPYGFPYIHASLFKEPILLIKSISNTNLV